MVKKKSQPVVYVPTSSNIPNTQQENLSVPDYEDRGIQFKGYSKQSMGGGDFKLKKQETRFYSNSMAVGVSTTTQVRPNATTHHFYCTGITISWNTIPGGAYKYYLFYDDNVNTPKYGIYLPPNITAVSTVCNGTSCIFIDFSQCPRKFTGSILVTVPAVLAAGEVIAYSLTGFDEEI